MSKPGMERADPVMSSDERVRTTVGRQYFSVSREATMPITPLCHVGS